MKSSGRIFALAAFLSASQVAALGAVAISDNAELFLTASATVTFDDNIYLASGSNSRVDDTIYKLSPGLDLIFGRNSQTTGNIFYRHDILRYTDRDAQNTDLSNFGVNSLYSNGKTKLDLGASYTQTAQNEATVPGFILERDSLRLRGLAEFGISQKTSIGIGVRYEDQDYRNSLFRDSSTWTAPVDIYFEYSPKLQMSAGYRFRSTNVDGGTFGDTRDHFLNIGARGEFTPKLIGQVRVGWSKRDPKNNNIPDDSRLGAEANLTYTYSEKTSVFFGITNDFGTSPLGVATEELGYHVGVNSRVDEQWSWNVQFAARSTDYPTRSDDYYQGAVGAAFRYSEDVSFSASYMHRRNNSTQNLDFRNNLFSLAANIRY